MTTSTPIQIACNTTRTTLDFITLHPNSKKLRCRFDFFIVSPFAVQHNCAGYFSRAHFNGGSQGRGTAVADGKPYWHGEARPGRDSKENDQISSD